MKKLLSFSFFVFLLSDTSLLLIAQTTESYEDWNSTTKEVPNTESESEESGTEPIVIDGLYERTISKEREPLAYEHLREADIFWQKRIWRVIDTRQKMNLPFVAEKEPLISIFNKIVGEHDDAYIFMDDEFKEQINYADVQGRLGAIDTIMVIDPDTFEETTKIIENDFNWMSVTKFRIKEDWVFDEESSTMKVRILGIAPIRDVIDSNGNYRGQEAMYWLYYPAIRKYLAKYDAANTFNDISGMSWVDIFDMRMFASYIMKESNIQDRRVKDYATGQDALLESEKIKENIFEMEHNLWSY
ncbi:MAG: gliding motility protein GldN [Chitinophagales bacterium]